MVTRKKQKAIARTAQRAQKSKHRRSTAAKLHTMLLPEHKATAKKVGMSISMISLVVRGKRMPSLSLAARLARFYGLTIDELYQHLAELWPEDVRAGISKLRPQAAA